MTSEQEQRLYVLRCLRDDRLRSRDGVTDASADSMMRITDALEVGPLFHRWVRRQGLESAWPESVIEHWRSQAHREITIETVRSRELANLARASEDKGIEALLYKGAALRRLAYDSPYVRPSFDTDLLLRERDLAPFSDILIQAGYDAEATDRGMGGHFEKVFVKPGPLGVPLVLDVHWALNNYPAIGRALPMEDVFRDSVPIASEGTAFRAVGKRHSLVMSGLHYCVHRSVNRRFIWLYDVKRLLNQLDERELTDLVAELPDANVRRLFRESVRLAHSTFDLEQPSWLRESAGEDRGVKSYYLREDRTPLTDLLQRVREFPTWQGKVAYLGAFLLPSASYIKQNYGGGSAVALAAGYLRFWVQELRTKLHRT